MTLSVFDLETPLSVLLFVWGPFGIMIVCCFILQDSFILEGFFGGESGLSVSSFELFILGSVITGELSEQTIAVFSLLVGGQGSDC